MAIDPMDKVVAALNGAQRRYFYKTSSALEAVGVLSTLWDAAGAPAAGAAQGTLNGANCDDTTTGAFALTNASSGNLYLLRALASALAVPGTILLYDRIWHNSTMSGTVTSAATITQPALPARVTDAGLGCLLAVEILTTAWGATTATLTVTYRDSVDDVDRTSTLTNVVPGGSGAPATKTFCELVPANTLGVKSVKSYVWNTTTGTAGNFGLVLYRPIARIVVPSPGVAQIHDFAQTGMPIILSDACLAMAWTGNATTAQGIYGELVIGEG
jgi:hypothetical protein